MSAVARDRQNCTDIYLTNKETRRFLFSFISLVLRNPISYRSIFIVLVYVHLVYAPIFHSTELSKSFICNENMFLHVLHVHSYALVVLLANCYVDTLH